MRIDQGQGAQCKGKQSVLASALVVLGLQAGAQTIQDQQAIDQQRRAEQRQAQQAAQLQKSPNVHLSTDAVGTTALLHPNETPCFLIHRLELDGKDSDSFTWLLDHADGHTQLPLPDPATGRCLGAQGVQQVIDRLQNALISQGYVTSRVLASPQKLDSGKLTLTLVPGTVRAIRWAAGSGQRASRWNTVPTNTGDTLNLRDIEQALENYKRVPTAEADIQITPGDEPGTSDLVISHKQPWPFRLSATTDDSGTRSTGKYQGSLTLSYDNWWTLSDLFYVKAGSPAFISAWQSLARDTGFAEQQHNFVDVRKYQSAYSYAEKIIPNLDQRSEVLKEIIWSGAVQHGNVKDGVLREAWKNSANASDEQLIREFYDKRLGYAEKYGLDMRKRYAEEQSKALDWLNKPRSQWR